MRKNGWRLILIAALAVAPGACASLVTPLVTPTVRTEPEALRPGAYGLDPAHATLLFKINHLGLSTYVGRFNSFDASLDFDADDPTSARLQALIDVTSLDVNNKLFAKTLLGPGWFDTENHPQARFVSEEIIITGKNTGIARGIITLKGVSQPMDINITFNGGANNLLSGAYTIGFEADASFKRSDHGIDKYVGLVGDNVRLEFYGEFLRQ